MKLTSYLYTADKPAFVESFCLLPSHVRLGHYRNALLPQQLENAVIKLQLPAPRNFWLLEENNASIGRIGANVSTHDRQTGYVGFFELDTSRADAAQAARILIDAACAFLREKVATVYGPVNLNTWLPYRFRTDECDDRGFAWEPVNPPEYVAHFQAAGFQRTVEYHSTAFANLEGFLDQTEPDYRRALAKGFTFRSLDWSRLLDRETPLLYRLTNEAFADSFLFETAPEPLFNHFISTLGKPEKDCTHFAVSPQGHEVGFFYAFTDMHPPSAATATDADAETYIVLKSTGVSKEARGQRLSNALAHLSVKSALAKGAQYCIAALVRSGLQSESYAKKGDHFWQHQYALFQRNLHT